MSDTTFDATPRGPYRRFSDPDGRDWLVWRLARDAVEEIREEPSLGRAWLIFLNPEGETRRLAPVPTDWQRMEDAQLYTLAQSALPFVRRDEAKED